MTRPLPGRLLLIGHPVSHSLSPRMQNAALSAAGVALEYEAVDVAPDALAETARLLVATHAAGNVTLPHKESFRRLCDECTPVAERVDAVNTFWVADDRLVGDNTDVGGFDAAVHRAFGPLPPDACVAVLGAGGGAAGVLAAIERWPGARAVVASRSAARAEALVRRFSRIATQAESYAHAVAGCALVVNATPIGLTGDAVPVELELLDAHAAVFDLAYRRGQTPWVVRARARGLRASDGLEMLIEQGALAFLRWFGREPDREAMRAAIT